MCEPSKQKGSWANTSYSGQFHRHGCVTSLAVDGAAGARKKGLKVVKLGSQFAQISIQSPLNLKS